MKVLKPILVAAALLAMSMVPFEAATAYPGMHDAAGPTPPASGPPASRTCWSGAGPCAGGGSSPPRR